MTIDVEAKFYAQHQGNPSLQAKRQFYLDQIGQSILKADQHLPEMRAELRLLGVAVEKLRQRAEGQEYISPYVRSIAKDQPIEPKQRQ